MLKFIGIWPGLVQFFCTLQLINSLDPIRTDSVNPGIKSVRAVKEKKELIISQKLNWFDIKKTSGLIVILN